MGINVENDILFTESFINGIELDGYHKIYYFSNEKLNNMLKNIDVHNKSILSVLGSGDQAFHFYNKGAKRVDLFDRNKLTIYYYYLRRWAIIYLNKYYPNHNNSDFCFNIEFINYLINHVTPIDDNENNALKYWRLFVDKFTDNDIEDLFYLPDDNEELENNKISDLNRIKCRLLEDEIIFFDRDFSLNVDLDHKYDLIYISNIPEWIYYKQGLMHLEILKYNLLRSLNKGGLVLGTNISSKEPPDTMRKLFRDCFSLKYIEGKNNTFDGYQYKRIIK